MTEATEVEVTQADEARALEIFNDALGDMSSFAEFGWPNYYDGALRTISVYLARHRQSSVPVQGEPVAVIGKDWQLLWASPEPLTSIVVKTGIKIGSLLYADTATSRESELLDVLKAIEEEGLRNHATRCAPWWKQVRAAIAQAQEPE